MNAISSNRGNYVGNVSVVDGSHQFVDETCAFLMVLIFISGRSGGSGNFMGRGGGNFGGSGNFGRGTPYLCSNTEDILPK